MPGSPNAEHLGRQRAEPSGMEVGKITHYFPKVSVAVLELAAPLKAGDMVEIVGRGRTFSQRVESMQVDHKPVADAAPGQSIGMKVVQPVHEGDKVFKLQPQASMV